MNFQKGCKFTRQKEKQKKKMEKIWRREGGSKGSSNHNTTRVFAQHMQVSEAPENGGALDRYLCVLVFVMSDEDSPPLPTSFSLFLLGFCTQSTMMLGLQNTHPNTHI